MAFYQNGKEDKASKLPLTEEPEFPALSPKSKIKSKSEEQLSPKGTQGVVHNGKGTATSKPPIPQNIRTTSGPIQEPARAATVQGPPRTDSAYAQNGARPQRPGLPRRRTTAQTRYIEMLLSLDRIPRLHNILASFFTWILLAGYIVFPATFNSLQQATSSSEIEAHVLGTFRNAPLLYVSSVACGIGALGTLYLYSLHRRNFIWVINRLWLPCLMNSIAGLISTIVNIYSAQGGQYSVTAKATVIVTGVCSIVAAGLFLVYNNIALEVVKSRHERETREFEEAEGRREEGGGMREEVGTEMREKEGMLGKFKRKAKEPGAVPGSVV